MKRIPIHFNDLTPTAQTQYLEAIGITGAHEQFDYRMGLDQVKLPGEKSPGPGPIGDLVFQEPGAVPVDGTELDVCQTCHSHTLKTEMFPDTVGKGLHESKVCSDPDCESHESDS